MDWVRREDAIRDALKDWEKARVLRSSVQGYGKVVYALWETDDGIRFLTVTILSKRGGVWRYKTVDEACGPYYFDCPPKMVMDAGKPANTYAAAWRLGCLRRAAEVRGWRATRYGKDDFVRVLKAVGEGRTKVDERISYLERYLGRKL